MAFNNYLQPRTMELTNVSLNKVGYQLEALRLLSVSAIHKDGVLLFLFLALQMSYASGVIGDNQLPCSKR
jgi:hypothetical protein